MGANSQKSVSFSLSRWRERVRVRVGRSGTHTCKWSRRALTPALSRREREQETPLKDVKLAHMPGMGRDTATTGCHIDLLRRSIIRQTNGVKINCMASSILPPGTTMVLARLMKLASIMLSRY